MRGHRVAVDEIMFMEAPKSVPRPSSNYGGHFPPPYSDPVISHSTSTDHDYVDRHFSSSATGSPLDSSSMPMSAESSPYNLSPWHMTAPSVPVATAAGQSSCAELIGSLVREEGHIYSLAAAGDLLYTGSDSKNIRVWKNQKDYSRFKSSSGLIKAIVIAGGRIFTGHQDGKIRIWKVRSKNPTIHKRIGSLPRVRDVLRSSLKRSNYVEGRGHRSSLWIRHSDAVSCLCISEDHGLLYSGSWDKTFKVWSIVDSRCIESVPAHDDSVNAIVAGSDGVVFTGSADGTVKVWRRELQVKGTKHSLRQTLMKTECAVTSLAVSPTAAVLYGGSSDGLVNFWEGERHLTHGGVLCIHQMAVLCLAAAGSLVVSGSADNTICVWRRDGGVHTCLSVLSAHTGPVKCLAMESDIGFGAEDGDARWIVYSGSLDKSIKMWRVTEQSSEALLRGPQNIPVDPTEFVSTAAVRRRLATTSTGCAELRLLQCRT